MVAPVVMVALAAAEMVVMVALAAVPVAAVAAIPTEAALAGRPLSNRRRRADLSALRIASASAGERQRHQRCKHACGHRPPNSGKCRSPFARMSPGANWFLFRVSAALEP
jgi:hypothetical protein